MIIWIILLISAVIVTITLLIIAIMNPYTALFVLTLTMIYAYATRYGSLRLTRKDKDDEKNI